MNITPLHPFNGLDIAELVRVRARTRKEHPFLVWEPFEGKHETLTYGAFHDRVVRLAAGMAKRGVKPREYVLIHLDNCPETLIAWYACADLGAVPVKLIFQGILQPRLDGRWRLQLLAAIENKDEKGGLVTKPPFVRYSLALRS